MDKLFEILKIPSVSGNEECMTKYIIDEIKDYCDSYHKDNLGNLIVAFNGGGESIMINTPIDEPGLFITHITEDKKLKFETVGRMAPENLVNRKVKSICNNSVGIVRTEKKEELKISGLYIDGANADIGDIFALEGECFAGEAGDKIFGCSISSKAGIYIAVSLIKKLYRSTDKSLTFTFTVQDGLGFKGARVAAQTVKPDYAFVIAAAGTENEAVKIKIGEGPVVRIKDRYMIASRCLRDKVIKSLSDGGIPYQPEILTKDGTSNNQMMYLENGILTANINIPAEGIGTYYEAVSRKDICDLIAGMELIITKDLQNGIKIDKMN